MIHEFFSRQFVNFLITGGTAAAVNFGSRIVYNLWVSYSTAIIIAYITGMVTAFVLAKLFVFQNSEQGLHKSALIFTIVNLVAIGQTWVISMALAYYVLPWLNIHTFAPEISHAIGISLPVFTSYIGHKRWSFR